MMNIVIATIHGWNIEAFNDWDSPPGYVKRLITDRSELTPENLSILAPKFVFFPHWSWIIPSEIYKNYECVVFHMTDLPFGRGGSPLQNLITRGIYHTKISAIKVVKELDAGPVYLKKPLNIEHGSAEEIFEQLSVLIFDMINKIIIEKPNPILQQGEVVTFKRRTPQESLIPDGLGLKQLYDYIRMLDAPGYPPAFTQMGSWKVEFRNAKLKDNKVVTDVTISRHN